MSATFKMPTSSNAQPIMTVKLVSFAMIPEYALQNDLEQNLRESEVVQRLEEFGKLDLDPEDITAVSCRMQLGKSTITS